MKIYHLRLVTAFYFLFGSLCLASTATPNNDNFEFVRVRLLQKQENLKISGVGLRFQNLNSPFRAVAIPEAGFAEVRILEKQGKKIWALKINGKEPERLLTEKFLLIQGDNLRAGSKALPNKILLSPQANATLDVVGLVEIDNYIVGVLASEMPLSWPLETLKAQAVAARSYALSVMSERRNKAYHLESSVMDQVFRHVAKGDIKDPLIAKALQAVAETKNLHLYQSNQKILKAFFHSDCGGQTTTAKNVWNSSVNAGVAVDSSCPTNSQAQWKLTLSKSELLRRLKLTHLSGLDLIRGPAELRVKSVRLALNDQESKTMSANDFRSLLGYQDLRSSMFELKTDGDKFVFAGQGFGHGVGLCQWGSRALGKDGQNFRQILKHYYPLAILK